MDILLIDLNFISWWHSTLMRYAISWRAGWPTSLEYGEVFWLDLNLKPCFEHQNEWKMLDYKVREMYKGPIVIEPTCRSTES
jgi:hypothetical protein